MSESIDDEYDDFISYRPPWSAVLGLFMLITVAALGLAIFLSVSESEEAEPTDATVAGNVDMDALNRRFDDMDAEMQLHIEQNRRLFDDRPR